MRSPHDGQSDVSARRARVLPYDSLEDDLQQPNGDLSREAVSIVYHRGLLDLVFDAAQVHRRAQDAADVQCASLLSVKTGGCPENCAYCPQSAHFRTEVEAEPLLPVEAVASAARDAKANGADRFCLGAAWREVQDGPSFDRVLEMVGAVKRAGLETCVTLGMLTPPQAARLRDAGLDYYNHNLDSGRGFYDQIITTRCYDDRLKTLEAVRAAGLKVCCGGILGMGESHDDRIDLLHELARQRPAARERADQHAGGGRRHAARGPAAGRLGRPAARGRRRAHPDAARPHPAQRGAAADGRHAAGILLPGRRQLHLPR